MTLEFTGSESLFVLHVRIVYHMQWNFHSAHQSGANSIRTCTRGFF